MKTKTIHRKNIFLTVAKIVAIFLIAIATKANAQGCAAGYTYTENSTQVTFTNTSIGASSYWWDFGDGSNGSALANPIHTYPHFGSYNLVLITFDAMSNPCDTLWQLITIGNVAPCDGSFTYIANGNQVVFTNTSIGAGYSHWNFGDGTTSTVVSPTHTYSNPGSYYVVLGTLDSIGNNCDSVWQLITIGNGAPCNGSFTYIVNGNQVILTNTSTGANSYLWNFGDGTTSTIVSPTHTYANPGSYYIVLGTSDSTGSDCDSVWQLITIPGTTAINDQFSSQFSLDNYPNPFNGSTNITYTIKQDALIELYVVDVLGKKIAAIEKETKTSGKHAIVWDSGNINQGIYFIQLKIDDRLSSKKIIVIK